VLIAGGIAKPFDKVWLDIVAAKSPRSGGEEKMS
jgi:hypothetical protein